MAKSALVRFKFETLFGVYDSHVRDSLRERNVNGGAIIKVHIELVKSFLGRAACHTHAATGTFRFVYVTSFLSYLDVEVTHEAFDFFHFAVRENVDFVALRAIDHFRGKNTSGTVERREGLVELRHTAAYRRSLFHDVHFVSRVRYIESRLNTGYSAAYYQSSLSNSRFSRGKRLVQKNFR